VTSIRLGLFFVLLALGASARAQDKSIVVASTTSTQDSGLFGHILPLFQAKTGITVKVVAVGTGQALDIGRRCDADAVFVHAKPEEEKFVAEGYGVKRLQVMYNDFVLLGPKSDPARVRGGKDIVEAFRAIDRAGAPFLSRGDDSGTNAAELAIWKTTGLDPAHSKPSWYRAIGQGMGATLNMASSAEAYTLSDRGTWISFRNKGDLEIIVEGDNRLSNQYGVILVNPQKCPAAKKEWAQVFIGWLVSPEGQNALASYRIAGHQLFFPNASAEEASAVVSPCEQFAWPVNREIGMFAAADLQTVGTGATVPAEQPALLLKLEPQEKVSFIEPPERGARFDGAKAGVVSFNVPKSGHYQVTLSADAWIDLIQDGHSLRSLGSSGRRNCPSVRKSVRFELQSGPAVLQLSSVPENAIKVAIVPAN
jgi:tungstate transport system substrate-binding protein